MTILKANSMNFSLRVWNDETQSTSKTARLKLVLGITHDSKQSLTVHDAKGKNQDKESIQHKQSQLTLLKCEQNKDLDDSATMSRQSRVSGAHVLFTRVFHSIHAAEKASRPIHRHTSCENSPSILLTQQLKSRKINNFFDIFYILVFW